jgi:8-oxo-dGTP pyrophosphatase MutT (NUDIX family)
MVGPCCSSRYPTRIANTHSFSGGKRDPEDGDDRVTAERETLEEIGLELTSENSIYCGGLDQRLVSTSGSSIPLMVLCPYGTSLQSIVLT